MAEFAGYHKRKFHHNGPMEMSPIQSKKKGVAVWAVTPGGGRIAASIASRLPDATLHVSAALPLEMDNARRFGRLSETLRGCFGDYAGHIFVMAAGIVVRAIAPLIQNKTVDPAVVVVDEAGRHAISLISGHIGGANRLAETVAGLIGAAPVITTATDVSGVPAIDAVAAESGWGIENPDAIKGVNMALLTRKAVSIYDPRGLLRGKLPRTLIRDAPDAGSLLTHDGPGVYVDDLQVDLSPRILILRPRWLSAGMGCNRDTPVHEMRALLLETLAAHRLSPASLERIASIDAKRDEAGLLALAGELGLPVDFFDRDRLDRTKGVQTPSAMVEKHMGTQSVCEAAAILASGNGTLIVPKQRTRNVTVAIARRNWPSSASDPAAPTTSPDGPGKF
jgi:cobalt-precorrin 5A hydrolase